MKNIKAYFSSLSSNIWFGFKTSYLASKKYFSLKLLLLLFSTFIPLITIWLWRGILNGIIDKSTNLVIIYLGIYLVLKLLLYILSRFDDYIRSRYSDELTFYIEAVMIQKTSRVDLSFFDSAVMGDKVRNTRSNFRIMEDTTWLVFNIISAFLSVITTLILVSAYNIWLGFLTIILLAPFMAYSKRHIERMYLLEKKQIRENRKKDYFNDVFFDNNVQFEIKLNRLGNYFIERYKKISTVLFNERKSEQIKHTIKSILLLIINFITEVLVLIFSIFDVLNNKIGIGDLQFNVSMVSRLREQSTQLMDNINSLFVNNTRLNELKEFINIKPEIEKSGSKTPNKNPRIEFKSVYFKYPNSKDYILKDCSFIIKENQKIGLVGINGSGKSTIIKLLFRFYDPQKGIILLDGLDIKEYDIYAVRDIFGVLFQDYVTYCLPLREIIGLSNFDERFNDEKLKSACDISGVTEIIKDWELGYDTILGRYYADNGKDLSEGQWQLVGLARAYFRESEFMILDEPSAFLDPISENRIFEQLYNLSKGKSSVIISHRLSNTTLVDKIIVIDDGHIIEQGSHFDLLKQKGKYAYLFNLQARKYK